VSGLSRTAWKRREAPGDCRRPHEHYRAGESRTEFMRARPQLACSFIGSPIEPAPDGTVLGYQRILGRELHRKRPHEASPRWGARRQDLAHDAQVVTHCEILCLQKCPPPGWPALIIGSGDRRAGRNQLLGDGIDNEPPLEPICVKRRDKGVNL
jgi:hypothetical protein